MAKGLSREKRTITHYFASQISAKSDIDYVLTDNNSQYDEYNLVGFYFNTWNI